MKKITLQIVMVFLFALMVSATANSANSPVKKVTGEDLQALLADGGQITVVDVREGRAFKSGHIPGAVNIPYNGRDKEHFTRLGKEERIVFVCYGGTMSNDIAGILLDDGYKYVYNLQRGMFGWHGELER
ncbi:MAG: rhodanese-like domain-containing protein [Deltaproteobacteria bacterium]|nr:rhodanese-like domain-containing protein [Deltaproteobacteria bacterium]